MQLNLGCGFNKMIGALNVDGYKICKPDYLLDLNKTPYPWKDEEFDSVTAFHVMEHLENWWEAFKETVRVTKKGGTIEIRVPHPSSNTAFTYRDHIQVLDIRSFDGIHSGPKGTTNAWFESQDKVQAKLISYHMVPFKQYNWMPNWMLEFVAAHMRNFIWEQRFLFEKI